MSEVEDAAGEYVRLDAEAEFVLAAVRTAYERVRAERAAAEREVFRRALRAHTDGRDPVLAAEVAIRDLGLPLMMDVAYETDPKRGFLGNMRHQCDGYCNEQYGRLGRPDTTEARER